MNQDEHRVDPESEPGGYGTPTPEQEMPGQEIHGQEMPGQEMPDPAEQRDTPERPGGALPDAAGDEFPTPQDPDAAPPPSATGKG